MTARGIGPATAVAFAREGADGMGIDIAGPVSATLEVEPATPEELFLDSDEARVVSGATYDVTGGDSANYTA